MAISKRRSILMALSLFAFVGLTQIILESYADARAGGGRSGGFRGSRSYSSPSKPSQPSQHSKTRGNSRPTTRLDDASKRRFYARLGHSGFGRISRLHALFRFS